MHIGPVWIAISERWLYSRQIFEGRVRGIHMLSATLSPWCGGQAGKSYFAGVNGVNAAPIS